MRTNLFYGFVLVLGIVVFFMFRPPEAETLSFYGFAESNETEVNYNYPVVVEEIFVRPGEFVERGTTLMRLTRRKAKEQLADQDFRIAQLKAEEQLWRQRKTADLLQKERAGQDALSEIDERIQTLEQELAYKKSLSEGLSTIAADQLTAVYQPIKDKVARLKAERDRKARALTLELDNLKREIQIGDNPYQEEVRRLTAEKDFESSQRVQEVIVTAPANGIIGNISCKEEEHVPAYEVLLSFYEPHSSIVRGYVHEDLTLRVSLGDPFEVLSLKDETVAYPGKVIGLGSRIVETPLRLRKIPSVKTYGREVIVEIPKENSFLQKEKVGLRNLN